MPRLEHLQSHRDLLLEYRCCMHTRSRNKFVVAQMIKYVTSISVCLSYLSGSCLSCLAIRFICLFDPSSNWLCLLF